LALAANAKEPLGTEGVGVCGLWVTVTARGQGRLALTIDALVSGRAQAKIIKMITVVILHYPDFIIS